MSINPQSPHEFIRGLFSYLNVSQGDAGTVGHRLLEPLQAYIRETGTQDAAVLYLARELNSLRRASIEEVKGNPKIFEIFAEAILHSSEPAPVTPQATAAAQSQDSAIVRGTDAEVSALRAELTKGHGILHSIVENPTDLESEVPIHFAGERFTLDLLQDKFLADRITEELTQERVSSVLGGQTREFPAIFLRDHQSQQHYQSCSFSSDRPMLPTFSMQAFLKLAKIFIDAIAPRASEKEKRLLFDLLLLCNTQTPGNFFLGPLVTGLNMILFQAGTNLHSRLFYNINFSSIDQPNAFSASIEGRIYCTSKDSPKGPEEVLEQYFRANGIERPPYLDIRVEFEMGVDGGKLFAHLIRNEGRVVCFNPKEAIERSLGYSSEALDTLKEQVIILRQALAEKFDQIYAEYQSSVFEELRLNLTADTETSEVEIDAGHGVLVDESIPSVFEQDHVAHQRSPTISYKIGDSEAKKIVDRQQAELVICDAKDYAMSFSSNLKVDQKIFEKLLCLCTQQLSNSVVGIFMGLCNMERLRLQPGLQTCIVIDHGEVTLSKSRSRLGPDEIKINYNFHAILSPFEYEPNPDLDASLKITGLYQIIGVSLSGSLTLDPKRSGEFEMKDFSPKVLLDRP